MVKVRYFSTAALSFERRLHPRHVLKDSMIHVDILRNSFTNHLRKKYMWEKSIKRISIFFVLFVPRREYVHDRFQLPGRKAATFRFRGVSACWHHLSVSRPFDFRLIIQVLLWMPMIWNVCVRRLKLCFTSIVEDGWSKWRPGQESNSQPSGYEP